MKQLNLFRDTAAGSALSGGYSLNEAIALSLHGLIDVAGQYDTWLCGFSGGKDSTAMITLIDHAINQGLLQRPKHLIVNTNDTLMELPPLAEHSDRLLGHLQRNGWRVFKTVPKLKYQTRDGRTTSGRFFVQLLGVGYPPPNSSFTWCRQRMKLDPLSKIWNTLREEYGNNILKLDGVRLGESAIRDKAIYSSCRKDDGECGSALVRQVSEGLTLSPVAHWRVCQIWEWLVLAEIEHGYPTTQVAEIYGVDIEEGIEDLSARTGCIGCPLVTATDHRKPKPDKALERVLRMPQWSHLAPLRQLSEIYWQLHFDYANRYIWDSTTKGNPKRHGKPGSLTLKARRGALAEILRVEAEVNALALQQGRRCIQLIAPEELELIHELLDSKAHPQGWSEGDLTGGDELPQFDLVDLPLLQGILKSP